MISPGERDAVLALLADYGWLIDEGRFDEWLDLFVEDCVYKVVPRENLTLGLPGCLILCETKDMLRDRVTALREANKFNIHIPRHLIGLPRVTRASADGLTVEASFTVFQSDQEGDSRLFSVGCYLDQVQLVGGALRLKQKVVIVELVRDPEPARDPALTVPRNPLNSTQEVAMTVSYFVRYQGQPNDPRAFLDHYRRTHAGLIQAFPGVRTAILHHPVAWSDPVAVKPDLRFMLAQITFDDAAALNAALQSEARQRSRADFKNMPPFVGEVTHQACEAEILF